MCKLNSGNRHPYPAAKHRHRDVWPLNINPTVSGAVVEPLETVGVATALLSVFVQPIVCVTPEWS